MSWREGFTRYSAISGKPMMTITKNGVSFNQASVQRMGLPPFVRLYFDRDRRRFAIEACAEKEDGVIVFYKDGRPTSKGVRWSNADLRQNFEQMMGWDTTAQSYRIAGTYYEDPSCALVFDLNDAITV